MFLKLLGSLMVLGASTYLGFALSAQCGRRPHELRTLQGLLQILENEMGYMSNLLCSAFERIAASSHDSVTVFFTQTVDILRRGDGTSASKAWEEAVKGNIGETSLNREDGEILLSFGNMLGSSDLEGQIKNIRLTLAQLKVQEEKAEESRKQNGKLYRNIGVLGGIAIVILLI